MNTSVLRLGNYVYENNLIFSKPRQVLALDPNFVVLSKKENSEYIGNIYKSVDISPIKLSSKILLNCGFVKNIIIENSGLKAYYVFDYIFITESNDGLFFIKFDADMRFIKEIKYLHELQNFYFETRGSELQINLL